jgi:hypothetical protein
LLHSGSFGSQTQSSLVPEQAVVSHEEQVSPGKLPLLPELLLAELLLLPELVPPVLLLLLPELLELELLLPEVPPELELLLVLGTHTPTSLDCGVQVVPVAQPLLVVGSQSSTQLPVVAVAEAELQNQPAPQRSLAAQAISREQVAVSLVMLPPWRQRPYCAAPPSPEASIGKQVPSAVLAAAQVPS